MDEDAPLAGPDPTRPFLRRLATFVVVWGLVLTALVHWRTSVLIRDDALTSARSFTDLIVATRSWNASHGGLWVPKAPGTTTNPLLAELGVSADATTTGGMALTLRNPAVMTAEISELLGATDGTTFRLTSLRPLNPSNKPDGHEAEGLASFASADDEHWRVVGGARPVLRYMRPLRTESACLPCHGRQGYRVGDVRGAISVSVPLDDVDEQADWNAVTIGLLGAIAMAAALVAVRRLVMRLRREIEAARAALVEAATVDSLTRTLNRRRTLERLGEEAERSGRSGEPLAVIMIDIDHFKDVNDSAGHAAGDVVLAEVAGRIKLAMRQYDTLGRIGGEEFLVIAPETDLQGAVALAERARRSVGDGAIAAGGRTLSVTVSLGVAMVEGAGREAIEAAIGTADDALYRSKAEGRDRVSAAGTERA